MFSVIDPQGATYGPADIHTIRQWVAEGRITPETAMTDESTGKTDSARVILAGYGVFLDDPSPTPPDFAHATSYAAANGSLLIGRLLAFLIDGVIALPLVWLAMLPIVTYFAGPLLGLYWLFRDVFIGNQSIGKRVMGFKVSVVRDGRFNASRSAIRNFIYAGYFLAIILFAGLTMGSWIVGVGTIVEAVFVVLNGRRLGDQVAGTQVVATGKLLIK